LANFVAIHLVSAVIFFLHGLATRSVERKPIVLLKSFALTLGVLLVMVVFLGLQLSKLVRQARDGRLARTALATQVKMGKGAQVSAINVSCTTDACQVVATVETPQLFEPVVVQAVQNVLEARMERPVELVIRSVQMSEASAVGYHYTASELVVAETSTDKRPTEALPEERIQRLLSEQAKMVPGSKLVDFSYDQQSEPPRVVATYLTTAPFDDALERGITNLLRGVLGHEVALELRYVGPLPETESPTTSPTPVGPAS
jgi:hypothetical protein